MLNKLANKLARVLIRGNHTGPAARVSNKCNRSNRPKVARLTGVVCAGLAAAGVLLLANTALAQSFNKPGNILIADQFNNRVIEVSPAGNVVWSFGLDHTSATRVWLSSSVPIVLSVYSRGLVS